MIRRPLPYPTVVYRPFSPSVMPHFSHFLAFSPSSTPSSTLSSTHSSPPISTPFSTPPQPPLQPPPQPLLNPLLNPLFNPLLTPPQPLLRAPPKPLLSCSQQLEASDGKQHLYKAVTKESPSCLIRKGSHACRKESSLVALGPVASVQATDRHAQAPPHFIITAQPAIRWCNFPKTRNVD